MDANVTYQQTIYYHQDPGHGWFEVSFKQLQALGLAPNDFTKYSYISQSRGSVFLEEDCDAQRYHERHVERLGMPPHIINEYYPGDSFIRNLPGIREVAA